ncbi:hypothetical protein [Natrononativus amylolyticus]|uniref:hypothetical protein n=1 Tax=Natrononativus amylolyticus TaxID=2963434 RepID=UPI0020CED477|nr:hypothetical protein [Natrononativus amylolyticus]
MSSDPTVENLEKVSSFGEEDLYRVDWETRIEIVVQLLLEEDASVLNAYGCDDHWHLRILFPDRESLATTYEFCEEYDLTIDVRRIHVRSVIPAPNSPVPAPSYEREKRFSAGAVPNRRFGGWEGGMWGRGAMWELSLRARSGRLGHERLLVSPLSVRRRCVFDCLSYGTRFTELSLTT